MTLQIEVSQVAAAMDAVEVAIRAETARLSVDEVVDICSAAAASRTGAS